MPLTTTFILTTIFTLKANAVKNILFRTSTLLLQFTLFRIFSYLAFQSHAYTSYLMLSENLIQQFYYITSRPLSRNTLIVLGFAALFPAATLYDTLLWALDSPGYVIRTSQSTGGSVQDKLLSDPGYIITLTTPPSSLSTLSIPQSLSTNLFAPGENITLSTYSAGPRIALPAPDPISAGSTPRIWLDLAGFAVGSDISFPQSSPSSSSSCAPTAMDNHLRWNCTLSPSDATSLWLEPRGNPRVWFSSTSQLDIQPNPRDNPWHELSRGGGTVGMKQVVSVTKGNQRHTFLQSTLKVSLSATSLQNADILDVMRAIWDGDPLFPVSPNPNDVTDVLNAAKGNESFTLGYLTQMDYGVHAFSVDLFFPSTTNSSTSLSSSSPPPQAQNFRITTTNITLIASTTLPVPPDPLTPCDSAYINLAYGSNVLDTTCTSQPLNGTGFLGQFTYDTVLLLPYTLSPSPSSPTSSSTALSQTALGWYTSNRNTLDSTLLSRAFLLSPPSSSSSSSAILTTTTEEPGISYLQLILILIPALFAVFAFLLMAGSHRKSYYKSSFYAAVATTTHLSQSPSQSSPLNPSAQSPSPSPPSSNSNSTSPSQTKKKIHCTSVSPFTHPPEIELKIGRNDHVVVGTPDRGTLANVGPEEVVAFAVHMEPFLRSPASMVYLEGGGGASGGRVSGEGVGRAI